MAPRSSARRAALPGSRPGRIARRGIAVIVVIVVVTAPLVDTFAHIVQTKAVRLVDADPRRAAAFRIAADERFFRWRLVAPRILHAFASAARSHSASVGRRNSSPVRSLNQRQYAVASSQVTPTTG